jgi:hypothetical protein
MNSKLGQGDLQRPVKLKSILCRRKLLGYWGLFSRKKHVKFAEPENTPNNSRHHIKDKWRKYVQQQFKTLRKMRRERALALEEEWKRRQAAVTQSKLQPWPSWGGAAANGSTTGSIIQLCRNATSYSSGLEDPSLERLLKFPIPEPGDPLHSAKVGLVRPTTLFP